MSDPRMDTFLKQAGITLLGTRRSRLIMPFTCAADRIMNDQAGH